jgi:hypothetical protein
MSDDAPTKTRKRKPLRDVKPRRSFHLQTYGTFPQYELLIKTIRKTLFGAHLPASWTYASDPNNPEKQQVSPQMNDLIEEGVSQSCYLLRQPKTVTDFTNGIPWGLSEDEIVKQAKSIAGKLARNQMDITRPYKRDAAGNLLRNDKGKPVKGYKRQMRIAEHTREETSHDEPLAPLVSPLQNYAVSVTGKTVSRGGTSTADYARASTNEIMGEFQKKAFRAILAAYLGDDDAEWLLDYLDGIYPRSAESDEMAEVFMLKLAPYADKLEQFRDLYTSKPLPRP